MNFATHFAALESHAEEILGDRVSGLTSTKEIASELGVQMEIAVGIYEAYNRIEAKRFDFAREFTRDRKTFDWQVTIVKV